MTRWLLILALLCTGAAPGTGCLTAFASQAFASAPVCEMGCCGMACCCVGDEVPLPEPAAPATLPAPNTWLSEIGLNGGSYLTAWGDDAGLVLPDASYSVACLGREYVAVQPWVCRWQT